MKFQPKQRPNELSRAAQSPATLLHSPTRLHALTTAVPTRIHARQASRWFQTRFHVALSHSATSSQRHLWRHRQHVCCHVALSRHATSSHRHPWRRSPNSSASTWRSRVAPRHHSATLGAIAQPSLFLPRVDLLLCHVITAPPIELIRLAALPLPRVALSL